jgi:hypothetical protein
MGIEECKLKIRVRPRARRNEVVALTDGVVELRVAASPRKGQANAEMVSYLARLLGIAKGDVRVIRGESSRDKLITVSGLDRDTVLGKLRKDMLSETDAGLHPRSG